MPSFVCWNVKDLKLAVIWSYGLLVGRYTSKFAGWKKFFSKYEMVLSNSFTPDDHHLRSSSGAISKQLFFVDERLVTFHRKHCLSCLRGSIRTKHMRNTS